MLTTDLNSDYSDMLSLLLQHQVEFMLIGAYALAIYGIPRSTGDIGLFIKCSPENARKVHAALIEFGAPVDPMNPSYLAHYGNMLQIGVAPCRIDLITHIDGVIFSEAKSEMALWDGLEIPVISQEYFKKNKRASARPKDLADILALEKNA